MPHGNDQGTAPHSISRFSQAFGQGQRATLFEVEGAIPGGQDHFGGAKLFFIKAAQFPASTIGFIEVPFKGRKIKRPGDRTFAEWTLTVLQDEENFIREDFVSWMNAINDHDFILGAASAGLFPDWNIRALKQDGTIPANQNILGVRLISCFPSEVGTLEFNYETVDTFVEFTVTMQYDYWMSIGSAADPPGAGARPVTTTGTSPRQAGGPAGGGGHQGPGVGPYGG